MSYVVNNHLNNLYVVSNKAVGPGKNAKLITVGPTSIPDSRVFGIRNICHFLIVATIFFSCVLIEVIY